MAWKIEYADAAARVVHKLDRQQAKRILDYMDYRVATAENPRQLGAALVGDRSGRWRYRVGDYRVICEIIDKRLVVLVIDVGNRRDIYR